MEVRKEQRTIVPRLGREDLIVKALKEKIPFRPIDF